MQRLFVLSLLVACGEQPEVQQISGGADPSAAPQAPAADPHGGMGKTPAAAAPKTARPELPGGTVQETMNSGGYTYARLDACGTDTWVAGPETALAVGDTVAIQGNMRMDGFKSPKLDRTFDRIVFTRAMSKTTAGIDCEAYIAASHGAPAAAKPGTADPHGSADPHGAPDPHAKAPDVPHGAPAMAKSVPPGRQGKVLETMESGGYRYARVDYCGTEAWVAGPSVPVAIGQTVSTGKPMPMKDFHSSSLNRTFPAIDFVTGLIVVDGEPDCS